METQRRSPPQTSTYSELKQQHFAHTDVTIEKGQICWAVQGQVCHNPERKLNKNVRSYFGLKLNSYWCEIKGKHFVVTVASGLMFCRCLPTSGLGSPQGSFRSGVVPLGVSSRF